MNSWLNDDDDLIQALGLGPEDFQVDDLIIPDEDLLDPDVEIMASKRNAETVKEAYQMGKLMRSGKTLHQSMGWAIWRLPRNQYPPPGYYGMRHVHALVSEKLQVETHVMTLDTTVSTINFSEIANDGALYQVFMKLMNSAVRMALHASGVLNNAPVCDTDWIQLRVNNADPSNGSDACAMTMMYGGLLSKLMTLRDLNKDPSKLIKSVIKQGVQLTDSNASWIVNTSTVFSVTIIRRERGNARRQFGLSDDNLYRSKSVICVKVKDKCAAAALILGAARQNPDQKEFKRLKAHKQAALFREVDNLYHQSGVVHDPQGDTYDAVAKMGDHLGYKVWIMELDAQRTKKFAYISEADHFRHIVLLCHNKHYDVIQNVAGFLNVRNYCMFCESFWQKNIPHQCDAKLCMYCRTFDCDYKMGTVSPQWCGPCETCNRSFPTPRCFECHENSFTCTILARCQDCKKTYKPENLEFHSCVVVGEDNYCKECKEPKGIGHVCCIPRMDELDDPNDKMGRMIFFDFETTQYLMGTHIVNYVVTMYSWSDEKFVHRTLDSFCKFLFSEQHKGCTAIAHNGKGYDFQFVRAWCVKKHRKLELIQTGRKIMGMIDKDTKIRFVDSLNFLPMSLAAFTKTFGFTTTIDGHELKKGHFPHFFNTPYNLARYNGPLPALKYFGGANMSTGGYKDLKEWHKQALITYSSKPYNMLREMDEYCESDVRLLKAGVMKFRELFLELTSIDPFKQYTIASTCFRIYRTHFMPEKTIMCQTQLNDMTYLLQLRREWIEFVVWKESYEIVQWPRDTSLDTLGTARDGDMEIILFFKHDYIHANLSVYERNAYNSYRRKQMFIVNNETKQFTHGYASATTKVVEVWCSDFVDQKSGDEYQAYLGARVVEERGDVKVHGRLDLRDAFFGGRVNAAKLLKDFMNGTVGMYADVTSLYPFVNYSCWYPMGAPDKYYRHGDMLHVYRSASGYDEVRCTPSCIPKPKGWWHDGCGGFMKSEPFAIPGYINQVLDEFTVEWFGFADCTVECPKDLYHPVLPERKGGKLVFDLESPKRGTWTTPEIDLALEMGYTLLKIHEVWQYQKTDDLFKRYVREFLKIKVESSGWGKMTDPVEQAAFIKEMKDDWGVDIDPSKMELNPGKRSISKLCLNSLWGKFGQNDVDYLTMVYTSGDLNKLLSKKFNEVTRVDQVAQDVLEVKYRTRKDFRSVTAANRFTNIPVAAFTTSWGRIKLYEGLRTLGRQVLYYDTDSIIYSYTPGTSDVNLDFSDQLGRWKDELEGGYMVGTFVSSGPKSYSYTKRSPSGKLEFVTKSKGLSLNARNSQLVNGPVMEQVVLGKGKVAAALSNPSRIRVVGGRMSAETGTVLSKSEIKKYQFTYCKRRVLNLEYDATGGRVIDTVPFGSVWDQEILGGEEPSEATLNAIVGDSEGKLEVVRDENGVLVLRNTVSAWEHVAPVTLDQMEDEEAEEMQKFLDECNVNFDEDVEEEQVRAPKRARTLNRNMFIDDEAEDEDDEEDEAISDIEADELERQREFIDDDDEDHVEWYNSALEHIRADNS